MQQHAATFFAQAEESTGADLPQFVKDEFDAFLECEILAHTFLRLRCGDCGHDKLLAFSCTRCGFFPSRGGLRMSQTVEHLVDHVFPTCPRIGGKLTAGNLPFVGVGLRCLAEIGGATLLTFSLSGWFRESCPAGPD